MCDLIATALAAQVALEVSPVASRDGLTFIRVRVVSCVCPEIWAEDKIPMGNKDCNGRPYTRIYAMIIAVSCIQSSPATNKRLLADAMLGIFPKHSWRMTKNDEEPSISL